MKNSRIAPHSRTGSAGSNAEGRHRFCVLEDLDTRDYMETLQVQMSAWETLHEDPACPDRIFFVQHPAVYTLGKRGGRENLVVSEDFLHSKGIDIVQTERGGNITYHGPGQAVLYPVVNLKRAGIGVADFVSGLEEIMKKTAADYGITANRDPKNHGLWVKNEKIGSVGLSIKKGISIHGLAMNIFLDLTPFAWINPCGLEDTTMTSIERELDRETDSSSSCFALSTDLTIDHIRNKFFNYFCRIFNYTHQEQKVTHV